MVDVEAAALGKYVYGQTKQSRRRFAPYLVNVRVLNFRSIDDGDGAASDHLKLSVGFQDNCSVFVDADTDEKWVHRDGGEEPADAMALSEVLVDDEFSRETKTWREHDELSAGCVSFAALCDHVIAQDACSCGSACNDDAVAMGAADRASEFGAAEHRDDAPLIAAGEEDAGDVFDQGEFFRVFAIGPGRDAYDVYLCAKLAKDRFVGIRHLERDARSGWKNRDLGVFGAACVFDHVAKDGANSNFVFGSADRDEGTAMRVRVRCLDVRRSFGVRAGFGLVVGHVGRSDTTVRRKFGKTGLHVSIPARLESQDHRAPTPKMW